MWELANRYAGSRVPAFTSKGSLHERRCTLDVVQGSKVATACFDRSTDIAVLTRREDLLKVVMSLTPMKVFTCRRGLRSARGHVLIAGLGIGYLTRRVLERKKVRSVTVVEWESDIARYFGSDIQRHPKLRRMVYEDIRKWLTESRLRKFDSILVDIWDEYHTAHGDRWFQGVKDTARALGIPTWGWGDIAY